MTVHVALAGQSEASCGQAADGEPVVPIDEALSEGGRHFDCVACHKVLAGDRKHSTGAEQ